MQQAGRERWQPGPAGQVGPSATRRTASPTGSELNLSPLAEETKQKVNDK